MEATNKELITNRVKQNKVYFYKLCYLFLGQEETIEQVIFKTINDIYPTLQQLDANFEEQFKKKLIENCFLKKGKKTHIPTSINIGIALYSLEDQVRWCLCFKYILNMDKKGIAKLLNTTEKMVEQNIITGFEALLQEINVTLNSVSIIDLLNYHEGRLSFVKYKYVNQTLVNDNSYMLEQLINIIDELNKFGEDLKPSDYFLEENKPLTIEQMKSRKRKQQFGTSIVAILLLAIIGVSSIGVSNLLHKWTVLTAEAVGFGEKVYISATDEKITITITHVAADEMQTILFYEIRDESNQYRYLTEYHNGMFDVLEKDIWDESQSRHNGYGQFHSVPRAHMGLLDKESISKGRLVLPPLKNEEETITVQFNSIEQFKDIDLFSDEVYRKENRKRIEGKWIFKVPITKQSPVTVELDKRIRKEGIEVVFQQLKMYPTGTFLAYNLVPVDVSKYNYYDVHFSHLEVDGKKYLLDYYLDRDNYINTMSQSDRILPFESIYFAKPEEIGIFLDRIVSEHDTNYTMQLDYEIDYKNTPKEYQFLDTTITIEDVQIGNRTIILLKEELKEDRSYDNFYFNFADQGNYGYGMSSEGVWIDEKGNIYESYEEVMELENPFNLRYISTQRNIEIFYSNEEWDPSMLPDELYISGYSKTKLISELFPISLE